MQWITNIYLQIRWNLLLKAKACILEAAMLNFALDPVFSQSSSSAEDLSSNPVGEGSLMKNVHSTTDGQREKFCAKSK